MDRLLRAIILTGTIATGLTLAACSSAPASVVGTWGDPDDSTGPSITFNDGGDYAGTDGCNRLGGSWKADGDSIDLGQMVSTKMFCEGVDTWLSKSRTAQIKDDKLSFVDESGEVVGTLEPAKS